MAGRKLDPAQGQKEKILEFVRANPGCTTRDIQAALLLKDLPRVGMYLERLSRAGAVQSVKVKGDRLLKWSAVAAEDGKLRASPFAALGL